MSTWIKKSRSGPRASHLRKLGEPARTERTSLYSGSRNQLAAGWHLMPITLGPQASCSPATLPALRQEHRPHDQPEHRPAPTARHPSQGRAEARKAVATAQQLGIVRRSTLFYCLRGASARAGPHPVPTPGAPTRPGITAILRLEFANSFSKVSALGSRKVGALQGKPNFAPMAAVRSGMAIHSSRFQILRSAAAL